MNRSEEEQETILHPVGSQTGITASAVEKLDDSWEEIPDKRAGTWYHRSRPETVAWVQTVQCIMYLDWYT